MLRSVVVATLLLTLAGPAWAIKDPETGETFPDKVKCEGADAQAAGVGVREATFGVDVYAVVLYVSTKAKGKSVRGTDECVMIRARFVRDVGVDKIKEAWLGGFKKHGLSAGDATVKKFLGAIKGEMKKKKEMVMITAGDKVVHKYMGSTVTISGAKKLASAIKKIYLGGGSPTPALVKDLGKRGFAKP
jgi:hypothetical protein